VSLNKQNDTEMRFLIVVSILFLILLYSCQSHRFMQFGQNWNYEAAITLLPSIKNDDFNKDSLSFQDYFIAEAKPIDVNIASSSESENESIFENKSDEFSKEKPFKMVASITKQSNFQNKRPARPENYISIPSILKVKTQKNVTLEKHTIIDVLILIGIFTFFTLFFMLVFKITFWLAIIIAGINLSIVLLLTFFLLLRAFTF
jgi:hypothetical protein